MKLKEITFIFENCDSITVNGKYIGAFIVDNLHTSVRRIACNAIEKVEIAETIVVEIHKDANINRYDFDCKSCEHTHTVFDRISYGDITSVEFTLYDTYADNAETTEDKYSFYTYWKGDDAVTNEAQKTYVSTCNSLYLVITKDKGVFDFFDKEEIDDTNIMDRQYSLMDVGDVYGDPDRYKTEK